MARPVVDSYTKTVLADEGYVSPIKGINEPRTFFKKTEFWKCSAEYRVQPADYGWKLTRQNTTDTLFPLFETEEIATRVMDWCVQNDASVELAIAYLLNGDLDPLLRLLDYIGEVARGERPATIELVPYMEETDG